MTNAHGHPYNLRPSLEWVSHPENRLSAHPFAAANLPTEYTFGEGETIVDQGQLGSCTANMADEIMRYSEYSPRLSTLTTFRSSPRHLRAR